MKTSIEIAQNAKLLGINAITDKLGLADDDFDSYGKHTGKIRLDTYDKLKGNKDGKLILVTAMTPTRFGEGKTLTSVGLGQALEKIGKKGVVALREPSLGPVFGIKGGAAGGGYSQILPMADINLHFNGDIHAISAAHNLLSAMLDAHLHHGNELDINPTNIQWKRAMDMNDRALRNIVIGLGGPVHGIPRESGFVITAASEVMAILALATSRADFKKRLGNIVVGYNRSGEVIRARDLKAHDAMALLLDKALMPNIVQTLEHTPALIHAGPFANIAHGTNSVIADKFALKLADYVVTEAGFGADLGAEKFFDIVCRQSGLYPSTVVVVATCRAIRWHGGMEPDTELDQEKFKLGLANVQAHVRNMKKFGVPVVVAVNKFPDDTEWEINQVRNMAAENGVECEPHDAFYSGGEGAMALAEKVVASADANPNPTPKFLYDLDQSIEDKVEVVATQIYGADGVSFSPAAMSKLAQYKSLGFGELPICIAKTQSSLSDIANVRNVPKNWKLTVTDASLSAGAGFIVIICGSMMLMPGLGKVPAAVNMSIDENGIISGLF
ncbi:MAG: formate--tetrahydrofolate ligase [Calditrichaeota bacterium]|nr:MAG: formate--tetrahydrofolate ligase [Calditrichota bacterium]